MFSTVAHSHILVTLIRARFEPLNNETSSPCLGKEVCLPCFLCTVYREAICGPMLHTRSIIECHSHHISRNLTRLKEYFATGTFYLDLSTCVPLSVEVPSPFCFRGEICFTYFDVLLTVHLSIILVINQLNA